MSGSSTTPEVLSEILKLERSGKSCLKYILWEGYVERSPEGCGKLLGGDWSLVEDWSILQHIWVSGRYLSTFCLPSYGPAKLIRFSTYPSYAEALDLARRHFKGGP